MSDKEARRNKVIMRGIKEGKTDEQIRADLAPIDNEPEGVQKLMGQYVLSQLNNGKRMLGLLGAPAAGMAKAVETKNPLHFLTGTASAAKDAIMDPSKEQKSVSDVMNMPNKTWGDTGKRFTVDMLTDPTTYVGAGVLRGGARSALKGLGTSTLKAGGAAALFRTGASKVREEAMIRRALDDITIKAFSPNAPPEVTQEYTRLNRKLSDLLDARKLNK